MKVMHDLRYFWHGSIVEEEDDDEEIHLYGHITKQLFNAAIFPHQAFCSDRVPRGFSFSFFPLFFFYKAKMIGHGKKQKKERGPRLFCCFLGNGKKTLLSWTLHGLYI